MIQGTVTDYFSVTMEIAMKVNGSMTKNAGKVNSLLLMMMFTTVNGKITKGVAKEY